MRDCITGLMIYGFSSLAAAQPLAAYGFEFGKPLPLPECAKLVGTRVSYDLYEPEQPACGMGRAPTEAALNPSDFYAVRFPASAKPALSKHPVILVTVTDGNLEGVTVITNGFEAQDADLAALTEKYGKPTKATLVAATLRNGAKVNIHSAEWKGKNGSLIDFVGAGEDLKEGMLRIRSQKALKADANDEKRRKAEAAKSITPL